jgi:hypothetical protein
MHPNGAMFMTINKENIDVAIAETEEEIERLTRALAALKEASAFLNSRSAPSSASSHQARNRKHRRGREIEEDPRPGTKAAPSSGDLAGMLLPKVAEKVLEDADEKEGLSADEITRRAIARGYRSSSFRNPTNDPIKIAKSIRVTLSKLSEIFEVKAGKIRLKK